MVNDQNIEVDLPNDVLLALAMEAHRRDMKLNDYICEILLKHAKKELGD